MPRTMPSPAKGPQINRFSPPRAPQTPVERARLIDRIEASDAPLTLICAPAGFGKTTLMQQLRQRYQARDVAGRTGVGIVPPSASDLAGLFQHHEVGDPGLA